MTTSDLLSIIATGLANGKLGLHDIVHVRGLGGGFEPAAAHVAESKMFRGELWIEPADDTDTTERPEADNWHSLTSGND